MKRIPLSKGNFALVDDADYEWLNQWKWHICTGYAVRYDCTPGYKNKFKVFMHRLILGITDPAMKSDHIDRNKYNNQRYNLRKATSSQNGANRSAKKNGASKYLGVYRMVTKKRGKEYFYWAASIKSNHRANYIGCFKNETDAAKAYNLKAIELHGEFANLNHL